MPDERLSGRASERGQRLGLREKLSDRFAEAHEREWLCENWNGGKLDGMVFGIGEIAGHQKEMAGQFRVRSAQKLVDREAISAWHFQVADYEIELVFLERGFQLPRARQQSDAAAGALEGVANHLENSLLIVDHECVAHHGSLAGAHRGRAISGRGPGGLFARHRKLDVNRRALAGGAFRQDRPLMLLNDAVRDAEAQARSLPRRLGGEEGLEEMFTRFRRHPETVVAHDQVRGAPFIAAVDPDVAGVAVFVYRLL